MDYGTILGGVMIVAFFFLLRIPHVRHLPRGVDANFHLLATSRFKKGCPPRVFGKFIIADGFAQPPLLHLILSLFPVVKRPKILFALGVTADGCAMLLTYFLALQFVPEFYALIAMGIYAIIPATYVESISELPRSLGLLWYSLSIVLLSQQGIWALVSAAVAVALTFLSHKMAAQTLLFTCVIISPFLFSSNNMFPLMLLLGTALTFLVTWGRYVVILRDHVGILRFYVKYSWRHKRRQKLKSPTNLVKLQPYFYLPLIGLLLYPQMFLGEAVLFLAWSISVIALFLFWLLGDDYRFLAYSSVPIAILSAKAIYAGVNVLLIIPALVVSALFIAKSIRHSLKPPVLPDFSKINLPADAVTVVMPTSITSAAARFLNGKLLFGGGNVEATVFELETLPKIMSVSPRKLIDEYCVTHFLLGPKNQDFIKPFQDRLERVLETNGFVLFKLKDSSLQGIH